MNISYIRYSSKAYFITIVFNEITAACFIYTVLFLIIYRVVTTFAIIDNVTAVLQASIIMSLSQYLSNHIVPLSNSLKCSPP